MSGGRFKIIDSVLLGYSFAWKEAGYLIRVALVPLALQIVTTLYILLAQEDAGAIERFLWGFPSSIFVGWFLFIEARCVFFGEKLHKLKREEALAPRHLHAMRVSVMVYLLWSMAFTAAIAVFEWAALSGRLVQQDGLVLAACTFLVGALFWGLRFTVAHIVMGAGFSLKRFVFLVNGIEFSLRLVGLFLLCSLPLLFVSDLFLRVLVRAPATELGDGQRLFITVFSVVVSFVMIAVLNAASSFAVKEIITRGQEEAA